MKMSDIIRKLSSRKLWMAIAGVGMGVATAIGVEGSDIAVISGSITVLISVVTYIVTEGKIDAEGIKQLIEGVQKSVDLIEGADNGSN